MVHLSEIRPYPELESELEAVPNDIDARPVSSQPSDWTINTLREKYDRGQIDLQPEYQREYVWKIDLQSRLIESLLLQIPVPPLYFVKLNSGKLEVVDGQQRLTTLIRFISNEFALQKLQKLSSLNDKTFKDLSEQDQEKIRDSTIRSIVIDSGSNHDLRYEIFERLNRGSMPLNEQEIRNCTYRGEFCNLLRILERNPDWRKVKGTAEPEPRFKEQEMILRFFAFANRIEFYGSNLKKFLNDYMGMHAPKDKDKLVELDEMFCQTMRNVKLVFGENAGRIFSAANETGKWEPWFSISALDIQASALIGYSPSKIQSVAKEICEAYKFYLLTNPQIGDAISRRPASSAATRTRWFGFKSIVHELMNSASTSGLISDPLFGAKVLYRTEYFAAAGAMAGVVLEGHLKNLAMKQNPPLQMPKNATINPLNSALRQANVYDISQERLIQNMADIRNRCDHAVTNPPTKEDVWKLIEEVNRFMKEYPIQL